MSDTPEELDETTSAAAPAASDETPASTDSSQGASSEAAPSAEEESATPPHGDVLAGAVAEADEERSSENAEEAPDAEEAPEADVSDDAEESAAAETDDAPVATEKHRRADRAASTPRRRRERATREPGEPAPVVRAQAKYVRSSARKARLVCDHIRGKSVVEARAILAVTPRAIARDWSKLLESAVANAEHNHELVGEDLVVKAVHADEGPTIKRFRPRAMGRATQIRKRTSHLTILLTPKD
jgi:large subunit ribosomal protein L22